MEKLSIRELEDLLARWHDLDLLIFSTYSDLAALEPYKTIDNVGYQEKIERLKEFIEEEKECFDLLSSNEENIIVFIRALSNLTGLGIKDFGRDIELAVIDNDVLLAYRRIYNTIIYNESSRSVLNKIIDPHNFLNRISLPNQVAVENAIYLDYVRSFITLSNIEKDNLELEYKNIVINLLYFLLYLYPSLESSFIGSSFDIPKDVYLTGDLVADMNNYSEKQISYLKDYLHSIMQKDMYIFMDDSIISRFIRLILQRAMLFFKDERKIIIEEQLVRENLKVLEDYKKDKDLVKKVRLIKNE